MIHIDYGQGSIRTGGQGKSHLKSDVWDLNEEQLSSYVKIWRLGAPGREKSKCKSHKARMRFYSEEKEKKYDYMLGGESREEDLKRKGVQILFLFGWEFLEHFKKGSDNLICIKKIYMTAQVTMDFNGASVKTGISVGRLF